MILVASILPALIVEAQTSEAHPELLAFSDQNSVRLELNTPSPASLNGAPVIASIVSTLDSSTLWAGEIGKLNVSGDGVGRASGSVTGLHPREWSPQLPALYVVTVRVGAGVDGIVRRVRFGFRNATSLNGRILLNGRPVFLRGNAINPPERNIPDSLEENRRFVEAYVRYLKSVGVNIIRLTRHSQVWFDVCDELGMMLFQGNYGTPQGGSATKAPTRPLSESVAWYKREVIGPLVNHPSVLVYVLANEQADAEIPYLKDGAEGINRFLGSMNDSLHAWDSSRLYIANAGYGFGRKGDICDLHRYWGWYYNSFLSFYTMRDPNICWRSDQVQPMTMTENTGNYTGVDGRFNLVPGTKQPDSQLNWTGHAPESEQSSRALGYQAWMAGQAIEIYRRTREQNPNLAGLTPFTIVFHNWWGISRFEDMKPKAILRQYSVSYQPVLLSWELWTPNVYAGSTIRPVVHLVNDAEDGGDLTGLSVRYWLTGPGGKVYQDTRQEISPLAYYAASSKSVQIHLSASLPQGMFRLTGQLLRGSEVLSSNDISLFVAQQSFGKARSEIARRVTVLGDVRGKTVSVLRRAGFSARIVSSLKAVGPRDLLVIGANAWDASLTRDTAGLRTFVSHGGGLIILNQDFHNFSGAWLAVPVRLQSGELDHPKIFPGGRPFRNGMAVNPERPNHPVFDGITRDRLFLWSDFTSWDETKSGFPQVYPVTHGFVITDPTTLGNAAVLANYDHGLEGIALAELFDGKGSTLITGFDLINRAGLDPVADRMLVNIVQYMASGPGHDQSPLIDSKITWGDYASERGLVTGIYSGLLLNTVPVVPAALTNTYPISIDSVGYTFAGGTSGWNTKPAIQYVPHGRRVFGPYTFSSGGSVELVDRKSSEGFARVWVRVPASRSVMYSTISNPVSRPLDIEIVVDGSARRSSIPAYSTLTVWSPVRGGARPIAITFRADRRLVLLETDFR